MSDLKKPLVSVIMSVYNHESFVEEAIVSIINQTYGFNNIQLIVTDDGSIDNTNSILRKLAHGYDFKLMIHDTNKGVCCSLNEMISFSEGEYICPFSSDDIMIPDRIEKQVSILNQNPDIDILGGDAILIDEEGEVIFHRLKNPTESYVTYNFEQIFLLQWSGLCAGSTIIKRDLFLKIGCYDRNLKLEDYYFWLKAASSNAKILKYNIPFLYYRIHCKSFSACDKLMIQEVNKTLSVYKYHPKYSKALQNHEIYNMSKWIFRSKNSVIKHLFKNPHLLRNRKIIKVLLMYILPLFILKTRFPEEYYRTRPFVQ
jgi:alpha-1,3-rhamnosyltransferase